MMNELQKEYFDKVMSLARDYMNNDSRSEFGFVSINIQGKRFTVTANNGKGDFHLESFPEYMVSDAEARKLYENSVRNVENFLNV